MPKEPAEKPESAKTPSLEKRVARLEAFVASMESHPVGSALVAAFRANEGA